MRIELPADIEAERTVLSAMMRSMNAASAAAESLTPDHFSEAAHQRLFAAAREIAGRGMRPDTKALLVAGDFEEALIQEILGAGGRPTNVQVHCERVSERAHRRRLIEVAERIINGALDDSRDVVEVQNEAERDVLAVLQAVDVPLIELKDAINTTLEQMEAARDAPDGVTGIPSGLDRLDDYTAGWQDTDFIICAGRPGMGKTGLATTWAVHAADAGHGVLAFSLEMGAAQYALRKLSQKGRFDIHGARSGQLSDSDWQKVARAAGKLSGLPIWLVDRPGLTLADLRRMTRKAVTEHGVGLMIIDYLQLMEGAKDANNRNQALGQISRGLKQLARELEIPVIALAQLNRTCDSRNNKRPRLSDLRDSGELEQDADGVIFVYRDEEYGLMTDDAGRSTEGVAELIVAKQRNGPKGTARVAFVEQYAAFENLTSAYGGDGLPTPSVPPPNDEYPF